jgi:hypothetical protein
MGFPNDRALDLFLKIGQEVRMAANSLKVLGITLVGSMKELRKAFAAFESYEEPAYSPNSCNKLQRFNQEKQSLQPSRLTE